MAITSDHKVSFNLLPVKLFKAKCYLLISLSFLVFSFSSNAYTPKSISSISNVSKIVQDKRGFIWLSGQHGLTRVDDDSSITFSLNNQEWPLPYSWIHDATLIEDKLLLATETDGLWLFDTRNGKAEKLPVDIPKQSHYHAVMFKNHYYINAPKNFYRYDTETKETHLIDSNISINKLVHTKEQLYVANNDGLFQLRNEQLVQVLNEPITALTALSKAVIAVTPKHIYRLNDNGQVLSISHNEKVHALTKASHNDNFFTVSNEGKVRKYNGASLNTLSHHYGDSSPNLLRYLFHDLSGVLWLTSSNGVEQLTETYLQNHNVAFNIPINANEITLFDNEIIIGSYGAGLQNFLNPVFTPDTNAAFSKKGLKIYDVLEVDDTLFIASKDGLWRYDKNTMQVIKLNVVADKLILKLEHKNNLLYIATNDYGLYIYDLSTEKISKHIDVSDGLPSAEVIDVLALSSNNLWIASSSHVSIFQRESNQIFTLDTPNKSKVISLVYADKKIFASTLGDGILVFNQRGDLLSQISKGQTFTEMLLVNNEIWVSGKPGLYRLSPQNYQITMIANTQQYSFVSSMLVKDETLYAIHYSGILALDLSEQREFSPNVVISKTAISGQSYLLNKTINIANANDVITLDLASLDYRPGLTKKYQYRINNSYWQQMSHNQLTLTGLASGHYNIEIMATNSLGQWSPVKAYTEIHVAQPWYWTIEMRTIYAVSFLFILLFSSWLLYLRTNSIKKIHKLLKSDMKNCGKTIKIIQRNLRFAATSLANNELEQGKLLIEKSLLELEESINSQEPDNLEGKTLVLAVPFLADYIKLKYQVNVHFTLDDKADNFNYELKADIYKVIFEALISAIFKTKAENFQLTLQEVKDKLWLTISSDNDFFSQLDSRINFDLASYTIRQIINKHSASLNTFDNNDGSSQLVISFPLMPLN